MNETKLECWIGIDQSLHSTGVTIQFSDKPNIMFFQFVDGRFPHSQSVVFCEYKRIRHKDADFTTDELDIVKSAHNLFQAIYHYLALHCKKYEVWHVAMEGQVMSGFSRRQQFHLTDLVKLVSILQYNFLRLKNTTIKIFPPTSVKKYFTANGRADKDMMIKEFALRVKNFDFSGKIDDIVDSYAICEMIHAPHLYKRKEPRPKKQRVSRKK